MTKSDREDLKKAYFDGTEDSEKMLKFFAYVETLVDRVADLAQEDLFKK